MCLVPVRRRRLLRGRLFHALRQLRPGRVDGYLQAGARGPALRAATAWPRIHPPAVATGLATVRAPVASFPWARAVRLLRATVRPRWGRAPAMGEASVLRPSSRSNAAASPVRLVFAVPPAWAAVGCVPGFACNGGSCREQGLALHWRLDEATGATALDASGNGFNGTYLEGPPPAPPVRPDLDFTNMFSRAFGNNQAIRLAAMPAAVRPTAQLSLSIWYRASSSIPVVRPS